MRFSRPARTPMAIRVGAAGCGEASSSAPSNPAVKERFLELMGTPLPLELHGCNFPVRGSCVALLAKTFHVARPSLAHVEENLVVDPVQVGQAAVPDRLAGHWAVDLIDGH